MNGPFFLTTNLGVFIYTYFEPDYFSLNYHKPIPKDFSNTGNNKNLLIIYIESLEYNLRDKSIHGENIIQAIDNIDGLNIISFPSAPGTGWSTAAMVSSQCSLPLKACYQCLFKKNNSSLMLPHALCLGDILKAHGYHQYFLNTATRTFANMNRFYETHGYNAVFGKDYFVQNNINASLLTGWGSGPHDDVLLSEAKKIIQNNVQSGKKYNLTVMTTDNHSPTGFFSERCSDDEKNKGIIGAFKCSSRWISQFIKDLEKENLLTNTVVVLMGDHPYMKPIWQDKLFPEPRNVYFKIMNSDQKPTRETMTHFDVAPTILDSLEILKNKSSRFGLGYSIFADIDKSKYLEYLKQVRSPFIISFSPVYETFW